MFLWQSDYFMPPMTLVCSISVQSCRNTDWTRVRCHWSHHVCTDHTMKLFSTTSESSIFHILTTLAAHSTNLFPTCCHSYMAVLSLSFEAASLVVCIEIVGIRLPRARSFFNLSAAVNNTEKYDAFVGFWVCHLIRSSWDLSFLIWSRAESLFLIFCASCIHIWQHTTFCLFYSDALATESVSCLNAALSHLRNIWEEIGIPEDQRMQRTEVVKKHIKASGVKHSWE